MHHAKKIGAALMAGVLCLGALSGCASKEPAASTEGVTEATELQGENIYAFPTLGFTAAIPEELLSRMENNELTVRNEEIPTEDGTALQYGYLSWNTMTAAQPDGAEEGEYSLECFGVLGVYQAAMVEQLDALTGCDQHQELGQSDGGTYKYYLSTNSKADEALVALLRQIQIEITEMAGFQEYAGSDGPQSSFTGMSVGEFTTQDVNGNTYTQEIFQDYDLTLVNVFTTWCSPCVAEIPDLEELHKRMADRGVNVVGVVLDVLDANGEIDPESLEKAQLLAEQTGATYPFLLPDDTYMNGRLTGIEAFPESFFVDKDGNIVGETYSGSGSLEDWMTVVEQELANLQEGQ